MNQLKIKLFGAFRQYVPEGEIIIRQVQIKKVSDFKEYLYAEIQKVNPKFTDENLIQQSALATEERILHADEDMPIFSLTDKIALLPPVCGG